MGVLGGLLSPRCWRGSGFSGSKPGAEKGREWRESDHLKYAASSVEMDVVGGVGCDKVRWWSRVWARVQARVQAWARVQSQSRIQARV